jgi:hypothetical protein
LTAEHVEFGSEQLGGFQQDRDQSAVDAENVVRVEVRGSLEVTVHQANPVFSQEGLANSLREILRVANRLRHEADPNCSGGERQCPFGSEPTGELREDGEVGVKPNPVDPSDPERQE